MLKDETEKTQLSDDNDPMVRYKRENWAYKPASSNAYFYALALNTCAVTPFIVFLFFNEFFPGSGGMVSISLWGLVAAFALHIHRLRTYRYTPRRIKSAFPMIFFVFIWFCTVLLMDEWRFENMTIELSQRCKTVIMMGNLTQER